MRAAVFSDTHSNTALMLEAVRRTRPDVITIVAMLGAAGKNAKPEALSRPYIKGSR